MEVSIVKKAQKEDRVTYQSIIRNPMSITVLNIPNSKSEELNGIDAQSRMGRFGWPEDKTDVYFGIPYILRNSKKYFSLQMILNKATIRTQLLALNPDVYQYSNRVTQRATPVECRLLNEINRVHCDGAFRDAFGEKLVFNAKSQLIQDTEAIELRNFVDTCYRKLVQCPKTTSNKIGFIRFSSIFVPFVMRGDGQRYMPLHCFSNVNRLKVEYVSGWDLAYLRFCCLYQGIWRGSPDIFPVVSLTLLLTNLPSETQYEICWPTSSDHKLLRDVHVQEARRSNVLVINSCLRRSDIKKRKPVTIGDSFFFCKLNTR